MMFVSSRHVYPMVAMYVAVLAAFNPQVVESVTRRLELAVLNSDEFAESKLTTQSSKYPRGISAQDHAKISSVLDTTMEMVETAKVLVQQERTLKEGKDLMDQANAMFREVKDHIRQRQVKDPAATHAVVDRELLRKKYSDHDIQDAAADEERGLDVSRRIYETVRGFYNCIIFDVTNLSDFILQHFFIFVSRWSRSQSVLSSSSERAYASSTANLKTLASLPLTLRLLLMRSELLINLATIRS